MKKLDIAIAGCGIAGLSAALALWRQGHGVTLYERFAEPGPLGSGLMIQPSGLAVLDALGLASQVVAKGACVRGLLGLNTEGEAVLEADYARLRHEGAFGLGIHRASLFDCLYQAVLRSPARLQTGFGVAAVVEDGAQMRLVSEEGTRSEPHDLVVDALGLHSPLVPEFKTYLPFGALWAAVDWPASSAFDPGLLEQRYERSAKMVGVLPVGLGKAAFFWSLNHADYEGWKARPLAHWWDEVCALWPACEMLRGQITRHDQLVFARYAHRSSPASPDPRIVTIGDAWHAASPQLGQGANMALLDAWGLARALALAKDLSAAREHFAKMRRFHINLYQALTWAFTPPFQSSSSWPAALRDLLLAPASRIAPGPAIKAQLVAGLTGDPLGRLGLPMPDFAALNPAARAAR